MYFYSVLCLFHVEMSKPRIQEESGLERFTLGTRVIFQEVWLWRARKCQGAKSLGPRRDCNVFTCWWEGASQPNCCHPHRIQAVGSHLVWFMVIIFSLPRHEPKPSEVSVNHFPDSAMENNLWPLTLNIELIKFSLGSPP